ncbi:unnamed protein product [Lampetra planeri]
MADGEPPAKRVRLSDDELRGMSREDLFVRWKQQEGYLRTLESKLADLNSSDVTGLRESEERLKHQQQESLRRENILVMRLATKEQEMQECATQIASLKQGQLSSASHLRSCLVDPAVNLLFTKMKSELQQSKDKLQQAHDELSAWKFTPDSQTGKKLMSKCRMLIQENQELGRQLSQGRVAQLEAELALQKKYSQELKSGQDELNDFIIQLDEEVEGMQSTILVLQQQLKEARHKLQQVSAPAPGTGGPTTHGPAACQSPLTTAAAASSSAADGPSPTPPPPPPPPNATAARAPSESRSSPGRSPARLSEASAHGASDADRDFSPPPSPDDGSGCAGGSSDRAGELRSCSPAEGTSSREPGGGSGGGASRMETECAESPGEGGGGDGRVASAEHPSASPDTASGPQQSPEQSNGVCVASSSTAARPRSADSAGGGGATEPAASSPLDKEEDDDDDDDDEEEEDMETGGAGSVRGNHLAEERGGGVSSSGGVVKGYEDIDSPVGSDSPRSGPASPKPAGTAGAGGVEADTAGGATLNGFEHPSDTDSDDDDDDDEEDDDDEGSS